MEMLSAMVLWDFMWFEKKGGMSIKRNHHSVERRYVSTAKKKREPKPRDMVW